MTTGTSLIHRIVFSCYLLERQHAAAADWTDSCRAGGRGRLHFLWVMYWMQDSQASVVKLSPWPTCCINVDVSLQWNALSPLSAFGLTPSLTALVWMSFIDDLCVGRYTLCPIKKMRHFYICTNTGKYWPILIILSLSHSQMNCRKRLNKIYHLTSNLLPHYHAKIECSTQLLYSMVFQCNMLNSVSCVYADQFAIAKHCVKIVCPQHTNMIWDVHASEAISQWLCQWCVVNCCSAKCSNDV